jgi:cytochrome d ubiquinol oxidase subunit II
LIGVVVGNIIVGIPLAENHLFRGSWLGFLNPYALMVGVTTVALFMMHGAIYLTMKTQDRLYDKLTRLVKGSTIFFVMSLIIVTIYTLLYIPHMTDKLSANPVMFLIPLVMMLAVANITRQISKRKYLFAFLSSSVVIAVLLVIVALELYPTVIYAPNEPANSLTVYNAASSQKSLGIMLTFAAIGVPLVASYTVFVFYTFRGKVTLDESSY